MKLFYTVLITLFTLCLFFADSSAAIQFHGSARNSIYGYESDKQHTRIYQYARMRLSAADNRVYLNFSARTLSDVNEKLPDNRRFNAYAFNLHLKNLLPPKLELVLGRQFHHPGTRLGRLDGLTARYTVRPQIEICAYGGKEGHYTGSLDIHPDARTVLGGYVKLSRLYASRLQLLYLQKASGNAIDWQLAGLNLSNATVPRTVLRLQTHYDLQNDRLHRLLAQSRTTITGRLSFLLEYKSQYPQIYSSSFYTIFSPLAYKIYRTALTYELTGGYYLNGTFSAIDFETDPAQQFHFSVVNDNGSIGLLYESGYAGEQLAATFNYSLLVLPGVLASLYIDYSKYRTETVYEFDDQLANAARLSYSVNRRLSIDVEYQWLTNRFKARDSRVLNHILYRW